MRRMLCDGIFEGRARRLGKVGRSLVGDDLHALPSSERFGQHLNDVVGTLVVVDDHGLEELLVTTPDVLGGHELEGNAEGGGVGRVGAELGPGDDEVEAESWTTAPARAFLRRRGRLRQHLGRRVVTWPREPMAERSVGKRQRLAESRLGECRDLGLQPEPRANDQPSKGGPTELDVAEERRRHGE